MVAFLKSWQIASYFYKFVNFQSVQKYDTFMKSTVYIWKFEGKSFWAWLDGLFSVSASLRLHQRLRRPPAFARHGFNYLSVLSRVRLFPPALARSRSSQEVLVTDNFSRDFTNFSWYYFLCCRRHGFRQCCQLFPYEIFCAIVSKISL